ncbi:murein biosynthesis integral membrane protein MurJ [Candidatus Gottesmanbacteria bacterium RBG_16_43_7]|uniref:Probable lipid II flippase MurJ n=1 Tax=Candidatus Gottesmanbacteria bacterium RBG_16_43_7 TaxID=1798373 RepID=A0A1F5ZA26_9BACT|nr:MAG: murein biosynthesis integral membrane protein MurJ [Candidatus Gottesmanbacteria bacterium RBG_16_43_7]
MGYNKLIMRPFWVLLTRKQHSLGSAAVTLMSMVIISGLLGLIRHRILYDHFSPSETGIYFAAFRLPNLIFELLAMGSLTAAFIPVFTKFIAHGSTQDADKMAATVINISIILSVVVSIPIYVWTDVFSKLMAPGFTFEQIGQMSSYTRFMLVFQVLPLIIGNFFTGILQSYSYFLIPAFAPIIYNIGIIAGILLFSSTFGLFSAVIGVGIGAFLFLLVQIPAIILTGYKHSWHVNIKIPGVSEVGRLIAPRMIGIGVSQIDLTIDLVLSSLLGPKMVTIFFLAQNLQQLPVRLFGSTIAQAALPTLSSASAKEDRVQFKNSIVTASHMILFLVLPASVFFIVLRIPIVRLVYGAARFDWEATVLTALTLSWFSLSLFAQALSQVFTRGFYALYDSRTPVAVGFATILLNSLLSLFFIVSLGLPIWCLAVSTTIASIINMLFLFMLLARKIAGFSFQAVIIKPLKIITATFIMGIVIYVPMKLFDQLVFDTTRVFGLVTLTGIVAIIGLGTYLFLAWVMDIGEVRSFGILLAKIRKLRESLIQPTSDIVSGDPATP